MLSLGAKLFGSAGSGLTKRMAIGGLAGAILGDDGGDVLMGAAIGAVAPSRAATKGFLKEGKLFGKTNETLGQWGKTASKIPWKRGMVGAGVAGLGITANAIANSKFVDQYYTSYYGAGPETERTLESIKGVGKATMVTGIIGGGLYGLTGVSPISPLRAGGRAAMRIKESAGAAGQRLRAGAAGWSPFSQRIGTQGYMPGQGWGTRVGGGPGVPPGHEATRGVYRTFGQTVGGRALHSPLANRLFGSRKQNIMGIIGPDIGMPSRAGVVGSRRVGTGIWSGRGRRTGKPGFAKKWKDAGWQFGGKGFNRLGAVGRHPYLAGAAVGGALGTGGGFFAAGEAAQARGPGRGRIIGMDSGAGGMNPSMNFSTQGLGLNIHNRRRRRTLVD